MTTKNNIPVNISDIPLLSEDMFLTAVMELLKMESVRCIAYFAVKNIYSRTFRIYCGTANDVSGDIEIFATDIPFNKTVESLTPAYSPMHVFEREIHEKYGIKFENHPWLKPLRYPSDRFDKNMTPDSYPFFTVEREDLHEVGVGPVHAGIIEPGHFRFICDGEKIIHLETVLGYQHRGIENMMTGKPELRKILLAESIAGDSVVAHSLACVAGIESLAGFVPDEKLQQERCLALELERIAIHIADTSALCMDIAYQLGQVACEALRTIVINTVQLWCGNRFAKGLIRPEGTYYAVDIEICRQIRKNISEIISRYNDIASKILSLPSLLARFEDIGILTAEQAKLAGLTGLTARASGLARDIRKTHPFQYFTKLEHEIVTGKNGDILSRLKQRIVEIEQSYNIINKLVDLIEAGESVAKKTQYEPSLKPLQICFSLTEGWRGEICHTIMTDSSGNVSLYKIKDPSLHNWFGLSLAVRNQDISDFPICNKSFNLSYCGFDL
ncbi:MAG: NADH-quinone oxidoreductase subunit C [Prevotellaceae bacterium]|jgi:Ni,Fe-hydrogenase III large subunit|nr:NADH-quinone oxidoreductase subunit C [Prevotellaceae bacterium]